MSSSHANRRTRSPWVNPWLFPALMVLVIIRSAQGQPETGAIQGVIKYVPDKERPWRYARYYLKDPKQGFLSGAVVALKLPETIPTPAPETVRTQKIDQIDFQFVPEVTALRAGDAVRFTNSDFSLHNVMTSDGVQPFNVSINQGEEFLYTFSRAGGMDAPINIGCIFHGSMRAWIYVFDHPWFQVTRGEGTFQFERIPSGEYTLELVHPPGRLRTRRIVEVKPGATVEMEIQLSPDDLRTRSSGENLPADSGNPPKE